MLQLKTDIRNIMSNFGANETLTYSFTSERLLKKAGLDVTNSYKIVNSISPDLQLVRQSIVPSLLDKAYMNQKIPFNKFGLFEMNKVYQKAWGMDGESVPVEKMQLGFVLAERINDGTPYYKAKFFVESLLKELNITVNFLPIKNSTAEVLPFEAKRAAEVWAGETYLGVVGEFKNSVKRNFKLADYLAGFEINMDTLSEIKGAKKINNNFEIKDKQDLTITTKEDYAKVLEKVKQQYPEAVITPVSIYQPEGASDKNITFHLEFH